MEKALILQRLKDTIDKAKELEPHQFNLENWVTEYNYKNNCGTVCCIAGWYPKWFPEAGLKWDGELLVSTIHLFPGAAVREWHGFKFDHPIDYIFGFKLVFETIEVNGFTFGYSKYLDKVKLSEVIEQFEKLYEFIDTDVIPV